VPSLEDLLARDDVDVVDICASGDVHAEIAIAALEAGKHVICEKPLSNTVAEGEAMAEAAQQALARGILATVGYTYRFVPAIQMARQLVADGRLGVLRQVRTHYLQDWLVDPGFPMVWRLDSTRAGSGALGDLGAHIVDLAEYVSGERLTGVSALLETIVKTRPQRGQDGRADASLPSYPVTVDDAALFTARFEGAAIGLFEATRFAGGHENSIRLELNGAKGSLVFDFDAMHELRFWDATEDSPVSGWRTVVVGDPDPSVTKWWPPGHDYAFAAQMAELIAGIEDGHTTLPTFDDGLHVQRVLEAVQLSSRAGSRWQEVSR
jgi:predicted dehydrogenase